MLNYIMIIEKLLFVQTVHLFLQWTDHEKSFGRFHQSYLCFIFQRVLLNKMFYKCALCKNKKREK